MFVDGVPRVVCGVTEETTCQDVVIALAQALGMCTRGSLKDPPSDSDLVADPHHRSLSPGQPGRYTLRETFKDFERCLSPGERLLETLERYCEQAKEVQLTLHHNSPSVWDGTSRTKVGRCQPRPPLRRKDADARTRRDGGTPSLHRQSLPAMWTGQEAEQPKEDAKKPKRKSLTLVEEAWEWLESLGRGMVYSTASQRESNKRSHNRNSLDGFLLDDNDNSGRHKRKAKGQKSAKSDLEHQTSCCLGSQTRPKDSKRSTQGQEAQVVDHYRATSSARQDEENQLRETIANQLSCLQDLQLQIANMDTHICELEGKQRARRASQEAQKRLAEEEMEHVHFWENKLKLEEGYGKDLEHQFLEMKAKAVECKSRLEEYKRKMQRVNPFALQLQEDFQAGSHVATSLPGISTEDGEQQQSDPDGIGDRNRKLPPRQDLSSPPALPPPSPIKERPPTSPTELRGRWARRSEAQSSQSQATKVLHRSELTIYLSSAKV